MSQASLGTQAALWSEAGLGARAFLNAVPSGPTRMEPAVFAAELRTRLGVPEATDDCWCPRCDGVLDTTLECVWRGGERTQRHNAVRDLFFSWADRAGLRPEKERQGLLLPQSPEDMQSARRRPADVYLPALAGLLPHLISPSRRPSGRRLWPKRPEGREQPRPPTRATRKLISTQPGPARTRAWCLCPWSLKPLARGTKGLPL